VFQSLMHRETMDSMEDAIESFIKANPAATQIRAFVVDKDFKERKRLRKFFPHARILLYHYHVIKVFARKVRPRSVHICLFGNGIRLTARALSRPRNLSVAPRRRRMRYW
jgi:hypothetical protein